LDEKREITPKWVTGITSKLHFNTFRPLFQKLLEINVKFKTANINIFSMSRSAYHAILN
jgi:hypothetical protein